MNNTEPLLRYRVLVDNELLAYLPRDLNVWWQGRLLASSFRHAVGDWAPTIVIEQRYHFAFDRTLVKTDDPDIAAVLTALQQQGPEGMAKAIELLEARPEPAA